MSDTKNYFQDGHYFKVKYNIIPINLQLELTANVRLTKEYEKASKNMTYLRSIQRNSCQATHPTTTILATHIYSVPEDQYLQ